MIVRKTPVVAIVHLGRARARGEAARVRTWVDLINAAAGTPVPFPLLRAGRLTARVTRSALAAVAQGHAVPESVVWSPTTTLLALRELMPDAVVCMTSRAWNPLLQSGPWVTILDHVDRIGVSYEDRSRIARSAPRRMTYRILARTANRFEESSHHLDVTRVAAGWSDASALGATWLPNVVNVPPCPRPKPSGERAVDVCFVGTLSYPPNVAALRLLSQAWPAVLRARPATTALVAGGHPTPVVLALVRANGWELLADFGDAAEIYARARVAAAPLVTASGIQNKVLEAAAHGVPQVASDVALAGLAPGFPAAVANGAPALADRVIELLSDPSGAVRLAAAARLAVLRYTTSAWSSDVAGILAGYHRTLGPQTRRP